MIAQTIPSVATDLVQFPKVRRLIDTTPPARRRHRPLVFYQTKRRFGGDLVRLSYAVPYNLWQIFSY
jgi:hypothetical protein